MGHTRTLLRIVIPLIQIETIQVVGYRTVIEGCIRHRRSIAGSVANRIRVCLCLRLLIVTVHHLLALRGRWRSQNSLTVESTGSTGVNPAVLHISLILSGVILVGNTCGTERTRNTKVIDITAEVIEQ